MTYADWLSQQQTTFPFLTLQNSRVTSASDSKYNCIAWAAGDQNRWWWPDTQNQYYWPVSIPREETVEAFVLAYRSLGYSLRTDALLVASLDKVAIFADPQGKPLHAARQVADGWWASKLGQNVDIEHELNAVCGRQYGDVAVILAKA